MKYLLLIALLCTACTGPRTSGKQFARPKYDLHKQHDR